MTSLVVMLAFIAAGLLFSATRLAASAPPDAPAQTPRPTQQPESTSKADDPKLAGRFSGRVTDLEGNPVRGARLFVLPWRDELDYEPTARVTADALPIRAETDVEGHF